MVSYSGWKYKRSSIAEHPETTQMILFHTHHNQSIKLTNESFYTKSGMSGSPETPQAVMMNTEEVHVQAVGQSCSSIRPSLTFSDGVDERAIEVAENTSVVAILKSDAKDRRKPINRICPQVCTVCSGPANGYHYNVASCNGCKAFFRRSFVSGRRYECKKDRNCKLSKGRRTSCRACRYNKCIEVGMKPQLMQLSDDVISSRSSYPQMAKNTQFHETLAMQSRTSKLLWFDESEFAAIIGALVYNETQCDFLRRSTFDPSCTQLSLVDLISAPSELRNLHAYQLIREWPVKQPPPMDHHGQHRSSRKLTFKFWILCDLVVSVEFAKTLTFFERLSYNDKLLLSKNVAMANCSLMESYYSYKSKSNTIMFPDGIFPLLFTKRPLPMEVIMSCGGVESLIRSAIDECEYVLLKAIIFTHNSCEGLSVEGRTLLERESQKFARVLFNYTGARYGATIGSSRFAELLALIGTFFHLADKQRQFHTFLSIILHPPKRRFTLLEEMLA